MAGRRRITELLAGRRGLWIARCVDGERVGCAPCSRPIAGENVFAKSLLATVVLAIGMTLACVPAPRGPIDLQHVEAKVVYFGLAGPRSTVCPGEPVKMDISLDADVDGDHVRLVKHRFDIDDYIFDMRQMHLSSPHGIFDREGTFHPNPDVSATIHTGFVMYARAPHGPAFSVRFPPSYECTNTIGKDGPLGGPGLDGADATITDRNDDGNFAGSAPPAMGHPGQAGGEGGTGPHLAVYLTWVKTPDYTKLLAAHATGDYDRLTLVAPGTALDIIARGGQGGMGGRGGKGASALEPGDAGGIGGQGGQGGQGGRGGEVDVYIDERFSDIEHMLVVDVSGGIGGEGGFGGPGGEGATGEMRVRKNPKAPWTTRMPGRIGAQGAPGPAGARGSRGTSGRFVIHHAASDEVRASFKNHGAIVPF
jgi:hypothetical protein